MPQALDPAAYVYEGFWIDWTKGRTDGLTLTLSPTSANLLIATLAVFVTMSGGQLWTIVQFILHQIHAARSPTLSMLDHQLLVVLRNTTTDLATARLSFYLAWLWRQDATKPFLRCLIIVLIAASHAVFFLVAGAFSATLASAGQSVLSISPSCGVFNQTYLELAGRGINANSEDLFRLSLEFIDKKSHDVQLSLEYARDCYLSQGSNSSCTTFQQPRLNWTTQYSSPCPFESDACYNDSGVITFDTGPIDSRSDLGINGQDIDGLSYRRVTTCTVLNDTGHVTDWINGTDSPGVQASTEIAYAYYGQSVQYPTNWTYAYSDFSDFYTNFTGQTTMPYQVFPQIAYAEFLNASNPSTPTFVPLPQLQQSHADVILIFLSFTGRYLAQVDDPWFSAHQLHITDSHFPIVRQTYIRDRPISTLGCTEQHQVCLYNGHCTPLLGFDQVQDFISSSMTVTARQNATLYRTMQSVTASSLREVVEGLVISSTPMLAINATATASHTLSLGLPPNQWQLEANYWHSVAMAQLQRTFVECATGQIAAQTTYILPPETAADRWICANQMIRGTAFQSFSVLALALIVGFGSLVIVVSLNIENIAGYIQTRLSKGVAGGMEMWDDHDMLGDQLWRRAFERKSTQQQTCYQLQKHKSPQKTSASQNTTSNSSRPAAAAHIPRNQDQKIKLCQIKLKPLPPEPHARF